MAESQPDVRVEEGAPRLFIWLVPLVVAATELTAHATEQARRPEREDYRAVAATLGPRLRDTDQVLAAPAWTDPLLREQLGRRLGVARAGAVDLEPFERLFVVSQRGIFHPLAPARPPDAVERVGRLSVMRYDLGPSPVRYDFVEHWAEAEVSLVVDGAERPCARTVSAPRGGGLGQGAYWPSDRFVCDPVRPWLFVAPTVNEDLDLTLRRCLWHPPSGDAPFRVRFRHVPLGARLVVDADIYYEHERNEQHGVVPFELRVLIDGHDVGTLRHTDGDGRVRMTVETRRPGEAGPDTGEVTIESASANPYLRSVCWSGSTREAPREASR